MPQETECVLHFVSQLIIRLSLGIAELGYCAKQIGPVLRDLLALSRFVCHTSILRLVFNICDDSQVDRQEPVKIGVDSLVVLA